MAAGLSRHYKLASISGRPVDVDDRLSVSATFAEIATRTASVTRARGLRACDLEKMFGAACLNADHAFSSRLGIPTVRFSLVGGTRRKVDLVMENGPPD